MVDHVPEGVQPFLDRVVDLVVHGAYVLCDNPCLLQVRSSLQSNREGMEPWPPGLALAFRLDTP